MEDNAPDPKQRAEHCSLTTADDDTTTSSLSSIVSQESFRDHEECSKYDPDVTESEIDCGSEDPILLSSDSNTPFDVYVSTLVRSNETTLEQEDTPLTTPPPTRPTRRIVTFDEGMNQWYPHPDDSEERHARDFWYSREEYLRFRLFSSQLANTVTRTATSTELNRARTLIQLLTQSYAMCCASLMDSEDESSVEILTPDDQATLVHLYQTTGGPSLMGLEKIMVRSIGKDVLERRKELVAAVQEMQRGEAVPSCWQDELVNVTEEIRHSSEFLSQASILFARHVAQLHAQVL